MCGGGGARANHFLSVKQIAQMAQKHHLEYICFEDNIKTILHGVFELIKELFCISTG